VYFRHFRSVARLRLAGQPRAAVPTQNYLQTQLLYFFVVILAIENRPLLGALDDGAALAFDFLASGLVDAGFLQEKLFENLADFEADSVAVLDELDLIQVGYGVGNNMGEFVDFVAAQSHGRGVLRVVFVVLKE
jgi:hypothetical protein